MQIYNLRKSSNWIAGDRDLLEMPNKMKFKGQSYCQGRVNKMRAHKNFLVSKKYQIFL